MTDREKFIINIIVENFILRVLKKNSSKSVEMFRSYVENSGQNGVPKHFFANISGRMRDRRLDPKAKL